MITKIAPVVLACILFLTTEIAATEKMLPPKQLIPNLKTIAGRWQGPLTSPRGTVPYLLVINEAGTWQAISPNGSTDGTIQVEGGQAQGWSRTTGRRIIYTLHEDGGRRILRLDGEGGVTAELEPIK